MNKKRMILSLLAVFLLFGLVGCSSNDDSDNDQPPVEETEEDTEETEDDTEETEESKEDDLEAKYVHALEVAETDKKEAINLLFELGDYKDSREVTEELKYERAQELYEEEEYDEAYKIFVGLGNYKDAEDMVVEIRPLKSK